MKIGQVILKGPSMKTLKIYNNKENQAKLIVFLYHLMRDHLPSGAVESLVQASEEIDLEAEITFSNPYLLQYAMDLVKRLS